MQGQNSRFDPSTIDSGSLMEKLDANLDGVLTADETRMSQDMFSNGDTDSNGELTIEEMEEMLSKGPPAMGSVMGGSGGMGQLDIASILDQEDTDEDGSISIEETSLPNQLFSTIDTNQDGKISQAELEQATADKPPKSDNNKTLSAKQTLTTDLAMNAYQQAIESYMTNYTGDSYADANLSSFLATMA